MERKFTFSLIEKCLRDSNASLEYDVVRELRHMFHEMGEETICFREVSPFSVFGEGDLGYGLPNKRKRYFTLDEMVEKSVNSLSLAAGLAVQNLLNSLMVEDSTPEERKMVASISTRIIERDNKGNSNAQDYAPKKDSGYEAKKEEKEEAALIEQLKPIFFNEEEEAEKFLNSIQGLRPLQITQKVNDLVSERKISDVSKHRRLWQVLHDAGLYNKSESNWNQQVK